MKSRILRSCSLLTVGFFLALAGNAQAQNIPDPIVAQMLSTGHSSATAVGGMLDALTTQLVEAIKVATEESGAEAGTFITEGIVDLATHGAYSTHDEAYLVVRNGTQGLPSSLNYAIDEISGTLGDVFMLMPHTVKYRVWSDEGQMELNVSYVNNGMGADHSMSGSFTQQAPMEVEYQRHSAQSMTPTMELEITSQQGGTLKGPGIEIDIDETNTIQARLGADMQLQIISGEQFLNHEMRWFGQTFSWEDAIVRSIPSTRETNEIALAASGHILKNGEFYATYQVGGPSMSDFENCPAISIELNGEAYAAMPPMWACEGLSFGMQ